MGHDPSGFLMEAIAMGGVQGVNCFRGCSDRGPGPSWGSHSAWRHGAAQHDAIQSTALHISYKTTPLAHNAPHTHTHTFACDTRYARCTHAAGSTHHTPYLSSPTREHTLAERRLGILGRLARSAMMFFPLMIPGSGEKGRPVDGAAAHEVSK